MNKYKRILSSIATMSAGTVLAQAINVLVQPVLTRIVPAEILGQYTYLISLATVLIPIASLKLDLLIVTEDQDSSADLITDLCICLNVLLCLAYLAVILVSDVFNLTDMFTKYGAIGYLIPLIVFTNGLRFLFISYNNRYKEFGLIAKLGVVREGSRAVIQILSGVIGFGLIGQVFGYLLSPLVLLGKQASRYINNLRNRSFITKQQAISILHNGGFRHIAFLVPAQFANSLTSSMITVSVETLFSAEVLAYYSAGVRMLDVPLIFISANVSKVLFRHVSELIAEKERVFPIMVRAALLLFSGSFVIFGVLALVAPMLSEAYFGNGYETAGIYFRCLCPMYVCRLVATSFSGVLTAFERQDIELLINGLLVAFVFVSLQVSRLALLEPSSTFSLLGIGMAVAYTIILITYLILARIQDSSIDND